MRASLRNLDFGRPIREGTPEVGDDELLVEEVLVTEEVCVAEAKRRRKSEVSEKELARHEKENLRIDWYISLSAIQAHSRVSDVAAPETLGEPLSLERCQQLGFIFPATHNKNWESIKGNVKCDQFLAEGGQLFLADNGIALYGSIPAKYLTFHTRPPHEKDPAGRQWDRKPEKKRCS